MKGCLREAWDLAKDWQDQAPLSMRTPCPEDLAWALFIHALLMGTVWDVANASVWIPLGVGIVTMFSGLLWPGEWAKLKAGDIQIATILILNNIFWSKCL